MDNLRVSSIFALKSNQQKIFNLSHIAREYQITKHTFNIMQFFLKKKKIQRIFKMKKENKSQIF